MGSQGAYRESCFSLNFRSQASHKGPVRLVPVYPGCREPSSTAWKDTLSSRSNRIGCKLRMRPPLLGGRSINRSHRAHQLAVASIPLNSKPS